MAGIETHLKEKLKSVGVAQFIPSNLFIESKARERGTGNVIALDDDVVTTKAKFFKLHLLAHDDSCFNRAVVILFICLVWLFGGNFVNAIWERK